MYLWKKSGRKPPCHCGEKRHTFSPPSLSEKTDNIASAFTRVGSLAAATCHGL